LLVHPASLEINFHWQHNSLSIHELIMGCFSGSMP
jgi:hypothetical protein